MSTLPVITPEGEPAIAAPVAVMGHLIANFGGQKAFGFGYYRSFAPAFLLTGVFFLLTGAVMLRFFR